MKRGTRPLGYTIIEVMIFLAITGILFVSAAMMVSGQQSRTQFTQAVRDLDAKIRDTIDDSATGFFPSTGGITCSVTAAGPQITSGAAGQGTNSGCVFLGKVMQFAADGVDTRMNVYTIAGQRQSGVKEAETLAQARPTAVFGAADITQRLNTAYGLQITRVYSGATNYGSVAFFMTLGRYNGAAGNLISGAQSTDMIVVPGSSMNQPEAAAVNAINNMRVSANASHTNPSQGLVVCVRSDGNRRAAILIGDQGRSLTTEMRFEADTPAGCPA